MIDIISSVTIFALSIMIGYEIITKIPPMLHTPLMSGSNAISGIIIVGALVSIPQSSPTIANILGLFALILASINVVGGFAVTDRMLKMFGAKKQ
jgi:H+-translocating NAD(P) transhydrogenase subunit alpha